MDVLVRLLGGFSLEVDGRSVSASDFPRRSGASLVKLLALSPGLRRHREQVMDVLWPDLPPEDASNHLHKAAHYARKGTGVPGCLVLKNDMVSLFPGASVTVDALQFEAGAAQAVRTNDLGAVDDLLGSFTGELLPDDPYEPWTAQVRQRLGVLYRELLRLAGRWGDVVALDPTDEEAHLALAQSMLDRGDRTGALRQLDAVERVLNDELGIGLSPEGFDLRIRALDTPVSVPVVEVAAAHPTGPSRTDAKPTRNPRHASLATQTLRFCRADDGVRLAYATSGHGPPLVKVANWLTHLDYDWASPVWSHWWHVLSEHHRLIRYDERGCGLSDWNVAADSYTLDSWVHDLETVVDTLGLEHFDLLGISQGGAVATTFAARHPERVDRLVLYGAYAQGRARRARSAEQQALHAVQPDLVRAGWGLDSPAFRQVFTSQFMPGASKQLWDAFNELQRQTATPENAARLLEVTGAIDVTDAAREVGVPTLVMHAREDQRVPFEEGRRLAALIPGSQFVGIDSANHILLADEPGWDTFVATITDFLSRRSVRA